MLQGQTTPPILPSPARLGLPNPNSPSVSQNPNPNPNPNPRPSTTSAIASKRAPRLSSSASTLLPLLPPLPRAQSLLLQMSALATKLFDLSPNRAVWIASFRGGLPSFLPAPPPAADLPPLSSPKEVISLFTSLQTQLFEAVAEIQEIVNLQQSRIKTADEINSMDASLLSFTKKVREASLVLDQIGEDYSDYRRNPSEQSPSDFYSSLSLSDLLSYAHKISYTTFAPPEFGAGQAPLRGALPPAPQDEQTRASQLYHFSDLDVGIPKRAPESKEGGITLVEPIKEPTPPREAPPPPPLLPINVPPGWKKGMPVELPSGFPPIPPGWKPGDPINLPPLNELFGGARGEEERAAVPQPLPVAQATPARAPEVIQVKRVQLDINPDEDEYSSDYSSEVGSSDEDDDD